MLSTADASVFEANVAAEDKVEVVFRLNYAIPECDCKKQISKNSTKEEIDAIKQAHRDKLKELHTTQNNKCMLVNSYIEYQRLENQILACAKSDLVSSVNIGLPEEYKPSAIRSERTDSPLYPLSQAISDINASDQFYDGSEIPVGIIELGGITASTVDAELNHLTIRSHGETTLSDHAEIVTRILCGSNGVAPGVSDVYISGCPSHVYINDSIEFMIGYGVSLINMSWRPNNLTGQYHWTSAVLDYYASTYSLTFIVSAGNSGDVEGYAGVTAFATGYNVISVAALDANNTISTYSSYGADDELAVRKPTIAAPGTNIYLSGYAVSFGTSWATPMVTGVIAKLTEEYPFLSAYPEAIAPILAVSATPVNGQGNDWDEHAGAGRVNYEKAREATEHFWDFCFSENEYGVRAIRTINVDKNKRIKVAAGWFANSQTEIQFDNVLIRLHTDYDIFLTTSSGDSINGAESCGNTNIEYINYGNGLYDVIKINLGQYASKKTTYPDYLVLTWAYE